MNGDLVIVVPVRSLAGGKTRLAGVLAPDERETLVRRMLGHALATVAGAGLAARTYVVSPDPAALAVAAAAGAWPIPQSAAGPGLNAAIALGRERAAIDGLAAVLVLFADLPLLRAADLWRLVSFPGPAVISPDRHGTGTNALLLRPGGDAGSFAPHFGEGSAAAHRAEAAARGLAAATVATPGIAFDLDTPEDWWAFLDIAPEVADGWGLLHAGAPVLATCGAGASCAEAAW